MTLPYLQIFDSSGTLLRSIGRRLVRYPFGICVDFYGRVFVASRDTESIVVMDMRGTLLAEIAVPGNPYCMLMTREGKLVVSLLNGPSAFLVLYVNEA